MREEGREGRKEGRDGGRKGKREDRKQDSQICIPNVFSLLFFYHTAFFLTLLVLDESSVGLLPQTQTRKVSLLCLCVTYAPCSTCEFGLKVRSSIRKEKKEIEFP